MAKGRIFIGTSGWTYFDWVGTVYPEKFSSSKMFNFYRTHFESLELNTTFYHFPRESMVQRWKEAGGEDFAWSVKVWSWITHRKKLVDVKRETHDFFQRIRPLLTNGAALLQMPPDQKQDLEKLDAFLKIVPKDIRLAVEFRHNSWFEENTYEILRRHGTALVGIDAPQIRRDFETRTADFAYFRFHGSSRWYRHDYGDDELRVFARAVLKHAALGDVYIYFNNTADGDAFHNALRLKELLMLRMREAFFREPVFRYSKI